MFYGLSVPRTRIPQDLIKKAALIEGSEVAKNKADVW